MSRFRLFNGGFSPRLPRSILVLLWPLLACTLTAGCTSTSHFTLVSNKELTLNLDRRQYRGNFAGEDLRTIIIVFPLSKPSIQQAAENALRQGGGNLLRNASVKQHVFYIPLIGGQYGYVVQGDVYQVDRIVTQKPKEKKR